MQQFPSNDIKNILTSHMISISLNDFFKLDEVFFNELSSTLLCAFVDIMRLSAPYTIGSDQTMKYYLTYLTKYLLSYEGKFVPSSSSLDIKFEYIIDRLAKSNLLSLIVGALDDSFVDKLLTKFFQIQKEKCYEPKMEIFSNIVMIISGLLDELEGLSKEIQNELLSKLVKNGNKNEFELAKVILTKAKNIVSNSISDFITSSNCNLKGREFCHVMKELCNISIEFLVKFFLKCPKEKLTKKEINDVKYIEVLLKLFSSKSSLEIANKYNNIFSELLNKLTLKSEFHSRVYKCIFKFLSNNEIKKSDNYYIVCSKKISHYLKDCKTEKDCKTIMTLVKKTKKWKLIKLICLNLINSSSSIVSKTAINSTFEIIANNILYPSIIFDFNSIDKIKTLNKSSELFNSILNKASNKNEINEIFNTFINEVIYKNEDNSLTILIIFFYFSLQNTDSTSQWNNFMISNMTNNIQLFSFYSKTNNIKSILDFLSSYINCVDEESNMNSIIMLKSILYVLIYYFKYYIYKEETFSQKDIAESIINNIRQIFTYDIHNIEVINTIMILLKQLLYVEYSDVSIKQSINTFIIEEMSSFFFNNNKLFLKSYCIIYYELSQQNIKEQEVVLPKDLIIKLKDTKLENPLKFINELLKRDQNGAFNKLLFTDEIMSFILGELKQKTLKDTQEQQINLQENKNDNETKHSLLRLTSIYHEILKYQLYHLIKISKDNSNFEKEINTFLKFILNSIYDYFMNNYIDIDSLSKSKRKLVNNVYGEIQLVCIAKYINLLIKFCENEVKIKASFQIKIMNLLLCKEVFIRNHFIQKISKKVSHKNRSLNFYYRIIPMLIISLADPESNISKKAYEIISVFVHFLNDKLSKKEDKTSDSAYRYHPEIYISYVLGYFIFNNNLNILIQTGNKKDIAFFSQIINTFLKIIKKQCDNNLDSDFIMKIVNAIKNESMDKKKIIKKIFMKGIFLGLDEYELSDINYDSVKNTICDETIKIVKKSFMNDFSYGFIKPKLPLMFSKEQEHIEGTNDKTKSFILDPSKIVLMSSIIKSKNKRNSKENQPGSISKFNISNEIESDIIDHYANKSHSKKKKDNN